MRTRDVPESLRVDAVASEAGIIEWKRHGKVKHERNELHELASRIRKNTGRAIEKFIKLNPPAMVLATMMQQRAWIFQSPYSHEEPRRLVGRDGSGRECEKGKLC